MFPVLLFGREDKIIKRVEDSTCYLAVSLWMYNYDILALFIQGENEVIVRVAYEASFWMQLSCVDWLRSIGAVVGRVAVLLLL